MATMLGWQRRVPYAYHISPYFLQRIANVLTFNCDRLRAATILLRAQTAETAKQVVKVVTLGNNVGMYVVGEGVETQAQLAQLQKLNNGKGLVQG